MAENFDRRTGRSGGYQFGKQGYPTESGPYIGIVKNNIDPNRSARLQVYIEQFSGPNQEDRSNWRTVSYLPPFFGSTENNPQAAGNGNFISNKHSYGMWFTPPDIGTKVLCFFVAGDPNSGYYVGCIPEDSLNHMVPAIGASTNFQLGDSQAEYFKTARQLPVTEINNENKDLNEDPEFFKADKPIHSVVAGTMFQQGTINDPVRGPIASNSQRESPSTVFGFSTPGKAIYDGVRGDEYSTIKTKLQRGELTPDQVKVVGRQGGHSIVLDDGDLEGNDQLIRIRTSKGHQITMSDDGDAFYIVHANGQSWIELGKEGTLDVFSTNSVNVRTQGTINLHADKDINMYAGGKINQYSTAGTTIESNGEVGIRGIAGAKMYSPNTVGIKGDNSVAVKAGKTGSFDGGDRLDLKGGCVGLNSGGGLPVSAVVSIKKNKLSDTVFDSALGWKPEYNYLESIVTRAPTHEPWPFHNMGVENSVDFGESGETSLPSQVQSSIDSLNDVTPVGISEAEYAKTLPSKISVGNLDQDQVTGMIAQRAKDVGQEFNQVSDELGIGKFGLSAAQLEGAGYLKPGTVSRYLASGQSLDTALENPNVWSGKGGANVLTNFLGDEQLQTTAQEDLYLQSLSQLKDKGLVKGTEPAGQLGALVQAGAVHGTNNVQAWVKGTGDPTTNNAIELTARNAEYSINLVDTKITSLTKTYGNPGAYTNTTTRDSVDNAVTAIIGNDKVPAPNYTVKK